MEVPSKSSRALQSGCDHGVENQLIPLGMVSTTLQQARQHFFWKSHASVRLVDTTHALWKPADMEKRALKRKNGYVGFQLMYVGTVPRSYAGLLSVRAAAYV